MKYSEQKQLVSNLRELADFIEQPRSINLPSLDIRTIMTWVSCYEYYTNDEGERTYGNNPTKTKAKMRRIAKTLGSCSKEYDDYGFDLVKPIGKITLKFRAGREAVCKAVKTGEKRIVPSIYVPEHEEEVVEWVCDESLLATSDS